MVKTIKTVNYNTDDFFEEFFNTESTDKTYIVGLDEANEEDCAAYVKYKQILPGGYNSSEDIKQLIRDHQEFFIELPITYKGI